MSGSVCQMQADAVPECLNGHIMRNDTIQSVRTYWIIHIFALLHAVTTVLCRLAGVGDELLLTLLTIAMVVMICLQKRLTTEFTAGIVIVINVIGYFMGTWVAKLVGMLFASELVVHAVSTAFTTELIGWIVLWIGNAFRKLRRNERSSWMPQITWLVAIVCAIFLFRIFVVVLSAMDVLSEGGLYESCKVVLSNVPVLIIMVCVNIIYVRWLRIRGRGMSQSARMWRICAFVLASVIVYSLLVGLGIPLSLKALPSAIGMMQIGIVVLITEIVLYVVVYMIDFAWNSRQDIKAEKQKRHRAQYEYLRLKQQVNPHFLFNSLNVLDCLVQDGKNADASEFIHKMAAMYRYMLQNEDATLVTLEEELKYAGMYIDLLRMRFRDGFTVAVDVPDGLRKMQVVPCSIQMLVENALKHNAVVESNPLRLSIVAEDGSVSVTNNIRPKLSGSNAESLHVGLNYIRQQYLDLSGKEIRIEDDGVNYRVTLPLL